MRHDDDNLCTSHLYAWPPPTGIAVEKPGLGAGQLLFDCPHSAGEVRGYNIGTLTPMGFSVV